jgi:hypothetical protein
MDGVFFSFNKDTSYDTVEVAYCDHPDIINFLRPVWHYYRQLIFSYQMICLMLSVAASPKVITLSVANCTNVKNTIYFVSSSFHGNSVSATFFLIVLINLKKTEYHNIKFKA